MPFLKTPAVVLKSRKWGDADRIVTFFTLKHGKVRGVARGARRMKSRFGSSLEPFVHCDLVLFEKPGDTLYRVSQTDIRHAFPSIRTSLEAITGAARLANLAGAVTADGDAVPRVFQALLEGLRAVGDSGDPVLTAALYELEILRFAGYLPHLDRCNACQQRMEHARHRVAVGRHRARQVGEPGRAGDRFERGPEEREGVANISLGDAIEGVAGLLEQHEVAMDEGLQRAAEPALHPPGPAGDPPHLAVLQREEGDDPVGVPPLAALEDDGGGLEEGHPALLQM